MTIELYGAPIGITPPGQRIYIASKTKHAGWWRQVAEYHPVSSSWIYEAEPGQTLDYNRLWATIESEIRFGRALLAYHKPGEILKGVWIEIGIAFACDVPIHGVGFEEYTFGKAGFMTHHATFNQALRAALLEPER